MALKEPKMVKTVIGSSDLSLRADVGESFLIKAVRVYSAAGTYVTLKIDKTTVGYFRVDNTHGNHLHFPLVGKKSKNLLDLLFDLGIFTGYPVAEGETFVLSGAGGTSDIKQVEYEIYDSGDQTPDKPNGSKSKEYFYINYGDTGDDIATAGDQLYDNSLVPIEFPLFPYGADVPAKTTIEIHGITGKEVGVRDTNTSTGIYTRYLKMVKEREVLFDEDRNGFLFDYSNVAGNAGTYYAGGRSNIGNYDHLDERMPLIFNSPLVFEAGEELNVYVTTVQPVAEKVIGQAYQVLGMIMKVKRE